MKTLTSQNRIFNRWKPHLPCPFFLFNFPPVSRENRNLLAISHRKWPCRRGVLRLSFVRANCVSESASYGGWDNSILVGDSDSSGEAEADQFRNFLVSIGVDDKKYIFAFGLGLLCALAISRVRVSSIVVFPASVLVFAIGFSFGLVRGGGLGELNYSGKKRRVKDENFRVYVEKFRNLVEVLDDFDVKVTNLNCKILKAIDSREITVSDLEEYTKVLESVSLSALNARNAIEVSAENLGSSNVFLAENQNSDKREKELSEIGYDFFQCIGGLFKENLVNPKPTKVKNNVKRETMEDDQTGGSNLVRSDKETVLNPVNTNEPRANSVISQDSSKELPFDEDGYKRIRNGKMSWEEISGYGNRFNYSKEYGYENKNLQSMNHQRILMKMDHDNQIDSWESNDNLLESVNFSVRMKHTETSASFVREKKVEKSADIYRPSSCIREGSEYSANGSPLGKDSVNAKDDSHVAGQLSGHESEMASPSSSKVSDDVVFDRYLTEANHLLRQAKEFMRDGREKDRAEIILYKSAKLLSNAISMKPASLLAVGQLGNTYLLHGELKLRISRELRTLLYRSSPSIGKWDRLCDQMGSKDEITSALINVCEECEELLVEAGRKYRMALSIDGHDVRALYNWGLALSFRAQLIADIGPEAAFDADKVFMAAIDKFNAMMSKGKVYAPDALLRWGTVLQQRSRLRPRNSKEKVKLLQQAKRLYEDALGMDSNNVQVREALSMCISELSSRHF